MSNIMTGIREYNKRVNNIILEILYGNLLQTYDIHEFKHTNPKLKIKSRTIHILDILKQHIISRIDIMLFTNNIIIKLKLHDSVFALEINYVYDDSFKLKFIKLIDILLSLFCKRCNVSYTHADYPDWEYSRHVW